MFQRRHYEAIAETLANVPTNHESPVDYEGLKLLADRLADTFEYDNPNFDRERFLQACKVA